MHPTLRRVSRLAVWALALLIAAPTLAQPGFPTRPITLIIPFPAGGPSDALARALAQRMAENLGQPVVIENLGGANGVTGLGKVLKAAADGYTITYGGVGTHVANLALFRKLPYDPLTDFAPIGPAGGAPLLLMARADLPVADLRGFAEWLASQGDRASYASAGVGSISHSACVLLLAGMKRQARHQAYPGVAPAAKGLAGGQVDFMCDQSTTALPQLPGGRVKALALLSSPRLEALPGTATAAEAGYPLDLRSWNAFFAPRATPQPVLARLTGALQAALADPALRRQMQAVGVSLPAPADATPEAVTALIERGIRDDVPALRARGEYLD